MANTYCPICGEVNKCMSRGKGNNNCWCDTQKFPREIFELVPEDSKRKHCICLKCLNKYIEVQK
ncbi:cysteine-rich CWC family protein [Oceanobacillus senegalensis]|uniref:cysteine-rich CWC family protein n=1 Tax=Oceanobacillus senegalensis TaxID=1936063 RepID=UPI000A30FF57|nr:cysteine-rich CWC family protein [Oceanobacillus senegalensis]